jgi:hypothetical protein
MMDARKPRVVLCVFKNSADCLDAVAVLERLGFPREAMLRIAETGKPARRVTSRWTAGAWSEAPTPSADRSESDWIADFDRWAPPKLSADLHVFLQGGASILLARLSTGDDEAHVTGLLLRTAALTVQLHDLL